MRVKRFNLLLIFLFINGFIFSQDSIIIGKTNIIYKGEVYNNKSTKKKNGKWIELKLKPIVSYTNHGVGFDTTYIPEDSIIVEYENLFKGKYVNDKREGEWVEYYGNGVKKSEVTYKNGSIIGDIIIYYDNKIMKMKLIDKGKKYCVNKYNKIGELIEESKVTKKEVKGFFDYWDNSDSHQ